jgi:hypothetical protein
MFWPRDTARYTVWIGLVTIVTFYMAIIIASLVYCIPRKGQPNLKLSSVQGSFGVVSDFYLLAIPLFQITRLRVSASKRVAIAAVFSTGLL